MTDTSSTAVNRTLRRLPNSTYRPREYLTEKEVDRLIEAARKRGRNGPRDAAAILLAYRHGLRATELCSLKWSQIDLRHGRLHMNRAKGGQESVHPLHGPELRALRPLQGNSPYVFVTEAGTPVTTAWFLRMVQRTGKAAKLPFPIHPHMLRHQPDTSSLTRARTRDRLRTTWGTEIFRARPDIRPWPLTGLRASGRTERAGGGHYRRAGTSGSNHWHVANGCD
jgi:type 1 fimbriae regulatory protein FimB/type 1 fimbriae regulatory protein FimE